MSDQSSDAVAAAPAWRAFAAKVLSAVGAIGVIALVVAWGYSLGVSDPAAVPALAEEGAWRHEPRDAGGRVTPGQEIAAYSVFGEVREPEETASPAAGQERPREEDVAAARRRAAQHEAAARGEGGPVVDGVRRVAETAGAAERGVVIDLDLESPRPENVSATDAQTRVPGGGSASTTEGAAGPEETLASSETTSSGAEVETSPRGADGETTPPSEATEQETGTTPPPDTTAQTPETTPLSENATATGGAIETGPAPRRRPQTGPSATTEPVGVPRATLPLAGATPPPPPAPSSGPFRAQLAALPSPQAVRARWAELQAQQPQLLAGYRLEIVDVDVNGGRLYRLRIGGFARREDAAALCGRLSAVGVDCFPTRG